MWIIHPNLFSGNCVAFVRFDALYQAFARCTSAHPFEHNIFEMTRDIHGIIEHLLISMPLNVFERIQLNKFGLFDSNMNAKRNDFKWNDRLLILVVTVTSIVWMSN